MNLAPTPEELLAGARRLHAQGAGRFTLTIIRPPSTGALLAAAGAGDAESAALFFAVGDFLGRLGASGTLCLRCPRAAAPPGAIVMVLPLCGDASEALALAFCRRCALARRDHTLSSIALRALRRGLFPDLHELAVAPSGRA